MSPLRLLFSLSILVAACQSAKILGVIPTGGKSHHFVGSAYTKALAEAGHDVTVIAAIAEKSKPKNYKEIILTGMMEEMMKFMINPFEFPDMPAIMNMFFMYTDFGKITSEFTLNHPDVKQLLNSGETFDLVIVEAFLAEALYGMAQHFNASLITYSPFGSSTWTTDPTRTPVPTSHIANFILSYSDKMSFCERFWNTMVDWIDKAMYYTLHIPVQKQMYNEAFPNAKISFEKQMKSMSLVLLNSHFSLSSPRPYPPNVVEVGGVQINPVKPLPKDLQTFLDEAKDGAIYFSMGSYINSKDFPPEKRNAFINVFSRIKQRVVWKFEDDSIPNLPPNLLIKSWMPQNDILAHPNVKLFMTHGGLLGGTEALYHGKPTIGIPIFGDQAMNVQRAVKTGYGAELLFKDITEQTIQAALDKVLNDPSYGETARLLSKRYHDKPATAKETALFWMEYVIRHRGAPQLQSAALELTWVEYSLLDVYAAFAAMVVLMSVVTWRITKCVLRRVCRTKSSKNKKD